MEQREILEKRGVLSSDEIHRLASKTRNAMGGEDGKRAECHSEVADDDKAQTLQAVTLDPVTLEPSADQTTH